MKYVRYSVAQHQPHIAVGGLGNKASAVVLSNWKESPTPCWLKADLISEIVFNALRTVDCLSNCNTVTSDHYNADALIGLWSLINQDEALEKKQLLSEVARAGLLECCKNRDAVKISFVLDSWARYDLSPLKREIFHRRKEEIVSILYEELLPRFDKIMNNFDRLEQYWIQQESFLDECLSQIERKNISIEEVEEVDLAIVTLPDSGVPEGKERRKSSFCNTELCHPLAVNQNTDKGRILLVQENRFDFYYRPESWINCVSKDIPKRIDLTPLATNLTKLENNEGDWCFDGLEKRSPHLRRSDLKASAIRLERLKEELVWFLKT